MPENLVYIQHDVLRSFCKGLFIAAGLSEERAAITSHSVCLSSLRGTDSHGVRLVPHYLKVLETGRIDPDAEFLFDLTGQSTGVLDANHGMAHAAISKAMDEAIIMARDTGVGFVSIRNSNHCGAMAPFALQACEEDMIGFAFTNATAKLQTFNSRETFFGINPICVTAPMANEDPFCFDAAPTVMSNNKVKIMAAAGKSLPPNVGCDAEGNMTLNPALSRMLVPLGADLAGYKGFGMAMVVDILCSLLSGMPNGAEVSTMYESDGGDLSEKRYLAQLVGAMRIDAFTDLAEFKQRLQQTAIDVRKQAKGVNASDDVMVPGDPEKRTAKLRQETGIPIAASLLDDLNSYATKKNLELLKV